MAALGFCAVGSPAALAGGHGREWTDRATHLPLKLTVRSGRARQSTYWTYAPSLIDPAAPPADFFLLAVPPTPRNMRSRSTTPAGGCRGR